MELKLKYKINEVALFQQYNLKSWFHPNCKVNIIIEFFTRYFIKDLA